MLTDLNFHCSRLQGCGHEEASTLSGTLSPVSSDALRRQKKENVISLRTSRSQNNVLSEYLDRTEGTIVSRGGS